MNTTELKMNKLVYLNLFILKISKTALNQYWFDYAKPKYENETKLGCTDTDSFIVIMKPKDGYTDLAGDVETIFDTSNYVVDRPLPIGKKK